MKVFLTNLNAGASVATPLGTLPPGSSSTREVTPRALLAVKTALDAISDLFYSVWSANVREFGAVGNAVADDHAAIQLAYDTLRSLGGGTLTFPRGKYRVTDQIVNGYKFVTETDLDITTTDYSAAASFDGTAFASAQAAPAVHTVFEGGAVLWGDFTAAKAVLYNGICPGSGRGRVGYHNVTIVGKPGMSSGGTEVFPTTASGSPLAVVAPSTNVQGFFAAGAALEIRNLSVREVKRGGCLVSCYWSMVDGIETFHTDIAVCAPGSNAVRADDISMSYAATDGLQLSGQGAEFRGVATEECTRSIYVQSGDGLLIQSRYIEESSLTAATGYQVTVGDGTNNVVATKLECPHLSTLHGKSVQIAAHAQLTIASGSHLYPDAAHGVHLDAGTSVLWVENNAAAAIDPGGDQSNITLLDNALKVTGLKISGPRSTDGTSGIQMGRVGLAANPATNCLEVFQDSSTSPTLKFETFSGRIMHGNQTGIIAHAGGGQGSAASLDAEVHFVATVASAGDSLALPVGIAGMRIVIFNQGANAADVFPASGGSINALSANAAYSLAAGASVEFWAQSATQWRTR